MREHKYRYYITLLRTNLVIITTDSLASAFASCLSNKLLLSLRKNLGERADYEQHIAHPIILIVRESRLCLSPIYVLTHSSGKLSNNLLQFTAYNSLDLSCQQGSVDMVMIVLK